MPTAVMSAYPESSLLNIIAGLNVFLLEGDISNVSSTSFDITLGYQGDVLTATITGTGLTYTSSNGEWVPTGGTVSGMTAAIEGESLGSISGINMSMSTIAQAIQAVETGADDAALLKLLMSVDWTYYGNDTADVMHSDITFVAGNEPWNPAGNDVWHLGNGENNVYSGDGNDTIYGGAGREWLNAGDGNDTIYAGAGNDELSGNLGNDVVNGEAGDDSFYVYYTHGVDQMDGGSGTDYLYLSRWGSSQSFNFTLADPAVLQTLADGTSFVDIEQIDFYGGTNNDNVTGGALNDILGGYEGDDTLNGGGGDDKIYGGDGNDIVAGGAGADSLQGDDGLDTLNYWESALGVTVNLGANTASGGDAQGDTISGFENIWGSNGGNDDLFGSDGANFLLGGLGDDVIGGGASGDTLMGEGGWDTLNYWNSASGVGVNLGNNTAWGGDAQGDVISGFEAIWGSNGGNDDLFGSDGANFILGGLGDDAIGGGGGGDTLMGDGGWDTLNYWNSAGGVGVNLGNNTTWGGDAQGDVISGFEAIWGSNGGSDDLFGDDGANFILGGLGDDAIGGGGGGDTLMGEGGWDTLNYWNSVGGVTLDLGANTASGGDAQGDVISGFEAIWGSNGGDDFLFGSDGANFLLGGLGDDIIGGGGGGDTLMGEGGWDTLNYWNSAGGVGVNLSNNTAWGGDAQGDIISGFEAIWGSNGGNDWLFGSNGSNFIEAGEGNDALGGGAGSDTLSGGGGYDTAEFAGLQTDYTISDLGGGEWQVVHNATGDLDILHSIEELVFHSDWGYA